MEVEIMLLWLFVHLQKEGTTTGSPTEYVPGVSSDMFFLLKVYGLKKCECFFNFVTQKLVCYGTQCV